MRKTLVSLLLALAPITVVPQNPKLECLTANVYYEARGEPLAGKLAVALVTLNRVASNKYPNSICEVVYQKHQFSWTARLPSKKINSKLWRQASDAAVKAYLNPKILGVFKATHFHNSTVKPKWSYKLKFVKQIGNHIFYK